MKITNVNYSDEQSGSSIAVSRISKMLNDDKIISEILAINLHPLMKQIIFIK